MYSSSSAAGAKIKKKRKKIKIKKFTCEDFFFRNEFTKEKYSANKLALITRMKIMNEGKNTFEN